MFNLMIYAFCTFIYLFECSFNNILLHFTSSLSLSLPPFILFLFNFMISSIISLSLLCFHIPSGPLRLEIKKFESEARKLRLLINWRKPKTIGVAQHDSQKHHQTTSLNHDSETVAHIQIAEYLNSDVTVARFLDAKVSFTLPLSLAKLKCL